MTAPPYFAPLSGVPIDDDALADFLQAVIVGVTGLPGSLVRPRWQPEPPNLPPYGTDWVAFGIVDSTPDFAATVTHDPTAEAGIGADDVYQNEELNILISFYGPHARGNARLFGLGMMVDENRQNLMLAGMGLIEVGQPRTVSELINQKWTQKVDQPWRVRRAFTVVYPVPSLESASGTVISDAVNSNFDN